jgi:hypothetical protein
VARSAVGLAAGIAGDALFVAREAGCLLVVGIIAPGDRELTRDFALMNGMLMFIAGCRGALDGSDFERELPAFARACDVVAAPGGTAAVLAVVGDVRDLAYADPLAGAGRLGARLLIWR